MAFNATTATEPPGGIPNSTATIPPLSEHSGESAYPAPAATSEPEASDENPPYTNETIRALRVYAEWSYPRLHEVFGISLGSLHRITHPSISSSEGEQNSTDEASIEVTSYRVVYHGRGRHSVVTNELRTRLIATATANAHNRRLPYTQVAEVEGIHLGRRALRRVFESQGYHRRVARIKPFLSENSRTRRQQWGERFQDWRVEDWMDVIWTDECAFSVGEVTGTVWVTRRPGEEYVEDCLVPRVPRLTTIMVWGAIYRDQKSALVIWDTPSWGKINGSTYADHIIRPHLYPFWQYLHSIGSTSSGYIYIQQDNAPAHRSRIAQHTMSELGLENYLFPWPASSPDMSPIEGIWCLLKRRIMNLNPRPTTVSDLHTAILQEWQNISSQDIQNLTTSMPGRIAALLEANGGHTRF